MEHKFVKRTLITALSLLLSWALFIGIVDPFFHYHTPWFGMEPLVNDERYQNPGIARNFPYDSMILGSSMTENFRTGWFDEAFSCQTVKLPFSAARTGAYNWMLKLGYQTRPLKNVFIGLDNDSLIVPYGTYFFPLPEYLYDENPVNDVEYLCNLGVLKPAAGLIRANREGSVPPIEEAYVWDEPGIYGTEKVLDGVDWDMGKVAYHKDCSAYLDNCRENLEKNLLPHIQAHPETRFYLFFPPYSVVWWSKMYSSGQLDARLEVAEEAMELLLPYENVEIYYYHDKAGTVTDLDNYKDYNHYSAQVSREIVDWMAEGTGKVTKDNMQDFLQHTKELVLSFDYASLQK